MNPRVVVKDLAGVPVWETRQPEKIEAFAPFGALEARAKVTLHRETSPPALSLGAEVDIFFDDILKFRGEVTELRTHSAASPLILVAARRPERTFRGTVRKLYENVSPTGVLSDLLGLMPDPVLSYSGTPVSGRVLDRLDFQGTPLFYAIDLLAKLAGNWLWWIDWDHQLHFVPPDSPPEHVWYFDPDRMVLNPWRVDRSIKNLFSFQGGVAEGTEFLRFFEDTSSRDRFGDVEERLFARPITTDAVFEYLKQAVLEQAPWPTDYRSIDRFDGHLAAFPGERFELRGSPLLPLNPDQVFRIAAEEITWDEESSRIRFHLAQGYESASRYTRYLDHDPLGSDFVAAHLGSFRLDLSALDSEAHLD